MPLTLLASKALEGRIYSIGAQSAPIGVHKSTMELYRHSNQPTSVSDLFIEWACETADFVTSIGLTVVNNSLEDYDGVYSLPKEAIELLESAGIAVSEEYR